MCTKASAVCTNHNRQWKVQLFGHLFKTPRIFRPFGQKTSCRQKRRTVQKCTTIDTRDAAGLLWSEQQRLRYYWQRVINPLIVDLSLIRSRSHTFIVLCIHFLLGSRRILWQQPLNHFQQKLLSLCEITILCPVHLFYVCLCRRLFFGISKGKFRKFTM